ncbi:ATP-dependent kinase [Staphylotrichum tortipilum]|uniref:ATP-dependent kinase n=1 Tax=Staphylotrichum tortipilum TaxID=2831512 RepID=A0AAN6RVB8_9PEZI|nr:ATP-dependent kinase [Staphylotrichum longicolle]
MDDVLAHLANKIWAKFLTWPENKRFLVGIAGIPGSGKTTLSKRLTSAINARHASTSPDSPPIAAFVPMDGFHYTRAQLDAMPDPAEAHARRGAEFTFDGEAFAALVRRLAEPLDGETEAVLAPSFDHAVKDPREGDIRVERGQRIVVLEGNYLLLTLPPWSTTHPLYAHTLFISAPPSLARRRIAARHLATGLAPTLAAADQRAVDNDLPNGEYIVQHLRREGVDDVVESLEDGLWAE